MSITDFEVQKKLGQGAFSSVYKVLRKSDGQEYAMKKVKLGALNKKEKQNALNEVRILASLQSQYIVGYKEAFFDAQENSLFIILEYVSGGDLQTKIQHVRKKGPGFVFEEQLIWTYFIQMLQGLYDLHKKKIYHRDIKCANVFLTKDHKGVKLGDLNVAKVVKSDKLACTQAGTPYYASPEVWKDLPYDGRCDVWSLGCVIYEMSSLHPPFLARDLESLQKKVAKGNYESLNDRYSMELKRIIDRCLQVNVKNRPTVEQLLNTNEILSRTQDQFKFDETSNSLLSTIQVPINIRDLKNRLPKAKYHLTTDVSCLSNQSEVRQINKRSSSCEKENIIQNGLYQLRKYDDNQRSPRGESRSGSPKRKLNFAVLLPKINQEESSQRKIIKKQFSKHGSNNNTPVFKQMNNKVLVGHRILQRSPNIKSSRKLF